MFQFNSSTASASSGALEQFDPDRHLVLLGARINTALAVLPSKESPHNEKWQLGLAKEVVSWGSEFLKAMRIRLTSHVTDGGSHDDGMV